jgi:hypothetical protein
VRVALQPDQRLLWVGNNAADSAATGVTVIDTHSLKTLKHLATGAAITKSPSARTAASPSSAIATTAP